MSEKHWFPTTSNISLGEYEGVDYSIYNKKNNLDISISDVIYIEKGDIGIDEKANKISIILKEGNKSASFNKLEAESSIFGGEAILYKVAVNSHIPFTALMRKYLENISSVNFYGRDAAKTFNFSSKSMTLNDVVYNTYDPIESYNKLEIAHIICDDWTDVKILSFGGEDFYDVIENCNKGIIISEAILNNSNFSFNYKIKNNSVVPILPTALSSIFLTVFIYILTMVWFVLPKISYIANKYASDGHKLIENNIFALLSIITMVLFAAVYALLF